MDKYICAGIKGNKYLFLKVVEYEKNGVKGCFIDSKNGEWFTVDDEFIEIGTVKTITKSLN